MGKRSATHPLFVALPIHFGWCHAVIITNYRRNRVPGGIYFFTVNLQNRHSQLLTENVDILRDAVRKVVQNPFHKASFHIDAWAVFVNLIRSRKSGTSIAKNRQNLKLWGLLSQQAEDG
jgi:hypothetical protein